MRTHWAHAVAISTAITVLFAAIAIAQKKPSGIGALYRAVFEVDLFDENGKKSGSDQFAFVDGKLTTSEMRNLGCWSAPSTTKTTANGATLFEAVFVTPAGQDIRVEGTITGSAIEGKIQWPESDESMVWTYSGRRTVGILDGSRFDINLTPDDEATHVDEVDEDDEQSWQSTDSELYALVAELEKGTDRLVFENGGFESRNCAAVGLSMTSYSAEAYEGSVTFAAQTATGSAGIVEWSGDIDGDHIEGILTWTTPDGNAVYYSFSGRRVTG